MHGGTISAHSEGKDKGATFRVTLPEIWAEVEAAVDVDTTPSTPKKMSKRILLVEDHGDTAMMIRLLLEARGYEVETAGEVKQALHAVSLHDFDLLISDIGLPDQSGLEFMQELQGRGNMLKAIAMSGYGREEDLRRSREAGFSAYLIKPVDAEALIAAVERVI